MITRAITIMTTASTNAASLFLEPSAVKFPFANLPPIRYIYNILSARSPCAETDCRPFISRLSAPFGRPIPNGFGIHTTSRSTCGIPVPSSRSVPQFFPSLHADAWCLPTPTSAWFLLHPLNKHLMKRYHSDRIPKAQQRRETSMDSTLISKGNPA